MSDTGVVNGSRPAGSELSEAEYKQLCKQVRHYQLKNSKTKKKNKPVIKQRGKVNVKQVNISIEESPTDWDEIEDEPFSLDANGSQLFVKIGESRMKCVNTGKSKSVGGAAVYRVYL